MFYFETVEKQERERYTVNNKMTDTTERIKTYFVR